MDLPLLRSSGTTEDGFGEAVAFGGAVSVPVLRSEPLPGVDDLETREQRHQFTRFEVGANHSVERAERVLGILRPFALVVLECGVPRPKRGDEQTVIPFRVRKKLLRPWPQAISRAVAEGSMRSACSTRIWFGADPKTSGVLW
jgi:hypothetical protein